MKIAEVNTTNAVLGLQFAKLVSARDVKQKDDRKPVSGPESSKLQSKKSCEDFFTRSSSVSKIYQCAFQISSLKSYPNLVPPVYVSLGLYLNFHETDQSAAVILSQKFSFAHVKQ